MAKRAWIKAAAYHEAGHAVAAFEHGIRLIDVSIMPDWEGDSFGRVLVDGKRFCRVWGPKKRQAALLHLLAGFAAESKYRGRRNWVGAERDIEHARRLTPQLRAVEPVATAYLLYIIARADAFVAQPRIWAGIEALATELLAREELSGTEAIETIVKGMNALEAV